MKILNLARILAGMMISNGSIEPTRTIHEKNNLMSYEK
jgi:hypothetical protein